MSNGDTRFGQRTAFLRVHTQYCGHKPPGSLCVELQGYESEGVDFWSLMLSTEFSLEYGVPKVANQPGVQERAG
jgi:hypothetical protein